MTSHGSDRTPGAADRDRPALTACSLCTGETLGDGDPRPGGQLDRLRALETRGLAGLTLVECLDECERGDVVVVRPSVPGRRAGGRPVWFERLAGDEVTDALGAWLTDGGPGRAPVPDGLRGCRIRRTARADVDAEVDPVDTGAGQVHA